MHIEIIVDWLKTWKSQNSFPNLKGIYIKYAHFLLKFSLPNIVIALIFELQRWDDRMSHRYLEHIFALKDCKLFLHIAIIADWSKHGKIRTTKPANWLIMMAISN